MSKKNTTKKHHIIIEHSLYKLLTWPFKSIDKQRYHSNMYAIIYYDDIARFKITVTSFVLGL